jgi:hypothetical protein
VFAGCTRTMIAYLNYSPEKSRGTLLAYRDFGPRSIFTNAFSSGIRMANPPSRYPREWRAGAEAY